MMNKGGRPRLADKERKTRSFSIHLTEDEYKILKRISREMGTSLAGFAHHRLLSKRNENLAFTIKIGMVFANTNKEVNAIGVNINQAVARLNSLDANCKEPYLEAARRLETLMTDVKALMDTTADTLKWLSESTMETP